MKTETHKTDSPQTLEMLQFIVDNMVTKDDAINFATKDDLKRFATKDDLAQLEVRMDTKFATKADVREMLDKAKADILTEVPSHADVRSIVTFAVDKAKEDVLAEIRPMSRAQDDSVTVLRHEKRITRIERHLELT